MAKVVIKDGQIVSSDGSQVKFLNTPISGTTAEFTTVIAQNIQGPVTDTTAVRTSGDQEIEGTKTFKSPVYADSYVAESGDSSSPSYTFIDSPTTGIWAPSTTSALLTENNEPILDESGQPVQIVTSLNAIAFSTSGTERLRVHSNGLVSINSTQTTSHKLYVNGDAYVNGALEVSGLIQGNGSQITNINGSNISQGTVGTSYLPTSVVYTDTTQTITGTKTFSSNIVGSITGNAATATKLGTSRTITVSGDVGGSTSFDGSANVTISATLSNSGVSQGTYRSVTVDSKGRVTAGTNPTTADGYGLTDVVKLSGDQTIDGIKTFNSDISVNGFTIGRGTPNLDSNVVVGYNSLNNAGTNNQRSIAIGYEVIKNPLDSSWGNIGIGYKALTSLTYGDSNIALGNEAIFSLTTGHYNIGLGEETLHSLTTGQYNLSIGAYAQYTNTIGSHNISIGNEALYNNLTGNYNTSLGYQAGLYSTGTENIFVGRNAGDILSSGNNNVFIGSYAGQSATTLSNTIIFSAGLNKERMRIDSDGNVAINTTSASGYKLRVAGSAYIDHIVASNADITSLSCWDQAWFWGGIAGEGSNITGINAANISTGYLPIARIQDSTITNAKLENSSITINGTSVSLGGSTTVITIDNIDVGDGLSSATNSGIKTLSVNSTVVRTSGNQTISGIKSFTEDVLVGQNKLGMGNSSSTNSVFGQYNLNYYSSESDATFNTVFGYYSGYRLRYGNYNTLVGYSSGQNLIGSTTNYVDNNIIIGRSAGYTTSYVTGVYNNNVLIGPYAGHNLTSLNNTIILSAGSGQERLRIDQYGNMSIGTTSAYGHKFYVNGNSYVNGFLDVAGENGTAMTIAGDVTINNGLVKTTGTGKFQGDGSLLSNLNATNIVSGYLSVDRIQDSTITNAKLQNSSITINGATVSLGGSTTIETSSVDDIDVGDGLSSNTDLTTGVKTLSVNSSVVRTSGDQSIAGIKTFSSTIAGSITGNAGTATTLATSRSISSTGDIAWSVSFDGSVDVSSTATLSDTPVTPGIYRSVTVDQKGRITAGTNPTTADGYGLTDVVKTSGDQNVDGTKTFLKDLVVGSNKIGKGNNNTTNVIFGQGNFGAYSTSTTSTYNILLGYYSGYTLGGGSYNTLLGQYAGYSFYSGESYNVVLGTEAMRYLKGSYNVSIGHNALRSTGTYSGSDYNVAVGAFAGRYLRSSSDYNVFIGPYAGSEDLYLSNTIIFSAGYLQERMRIDSNGNVNIGTTTNINGYKLNVIGSGFFSGDLIVGGTITGDGSGLTNVVSTANVNQNIDGVKTFLNNLNVNGNLTVTGTITGNGSGLSNVVKTDNVNQTIDGLKTFSSNLTVNGDLTVGGTIYGMATSIENSLVFYNNGEGESNGASYDGTSEVHISYNTIGAAGLQASNSFTQQNTFNNGLIAYSNSSQGGLSSIRTTTLTSTLVNSFTVQANTSYNMVNEFGPTMRFVAKDTSNIENVLGYIGAVRSNNDDDTGSLVFLTNENGSQSEKMRITHDGKIAIGTNTAEKNLTIYADNPSIKLNNSNYSEFGLFFEYNMPGSTQNTAKILVDNAVTVGGINTSRMTFHSGLSTYGPAMTIYQDVVTINNLLQTPAIQTEEIITNSITISDNASFNKITVASNDYNNVNEGIYFTDPAGLNEVTSSLQNMLFNSGARRLALMTGTESCLSIHPGGSVIVGNNATDFSTLQGTYGFNNSSLVSFGDIVGFQNLYLYGYAQSNFKIKQTSNSGTSYPGLLVSQNGSTNNWCMFTNTHLYFANNGTNKGYISTSHTNVAITFTGQHRNKSDTIDIKTKDKYLGLIVVSDGTYESIDSSVVTINEALPKVSLASKRNQKSVWGVVSDIEDEQSSTREYALGSFVSVSDKTSEDTRLIINSLGEGGIWVCNINGNLENGDYITSCEIPGYGMKQDSEFLANYTVAKITCDCNFDLDSPIYMCEEFEFEGQIYRKAFVGCTYHCG